MIRKISYLVVEGPHDVEFVGKFLKHGSFSRVRNLDELDPAFKRLVPTDFPHKGDLLARVPIPTFFQKENHAVAVHSASGISNLATVANDNLHVIGGGIHSFGFVLDQDNQEAPTTRHTELVTAFKDTGASIILPNSPGSIGKGRPRTGAYILPDNVGTGALENLLIPAGKVAYPDLFKLAESYIDSVDISGYRCVDRKDFQKPSGRNKALVASVGSIFRPGKSIQVSIQDNLWITDDSIKDVPGLALFARFLAELLEDTALALVTDPNTDTPTAQTPKNDQV